VLTTLKLYKNYLILYYRFFPDVCWIRNTVRVYWVQICNSFWKCVLVSTLIKALLDFKRS